MNKQDIEKAIKCCERYKGVAETYGRKKGVKEDKRLIDLAISALEKQLTDMWIPITERLPEESIDGITDDFLPYNVSLKFEYGECVRTYQFGQGRWWKNGDDMTAYVVAWQPLPEPYKEVSNAKVLER